LLYFEDRIDERFQHRDFPLQLARSMLASGFRGSAFCSNADCDRTHQTAGT